MGDIEAIEMINNLMRCGSIDMNLAGPIGNDTRNKWE